jgi:hypothetical protein
MLGSSDSQGQMGSLLDALLRNERDTLPPKYAEYGRVANVRLNINKMATRATQHQQKVRICVVFIAFANLGPRQGITQRAIRRSRFPPVGHESPSVG